MQNPSFLHFPSFWKNTQLFVVAVVVVSLLILNSLLVIMTGGIPSAFAHTMYIPVLIAAYYFGPIVAAVTGILAGLLVGPAISWDFWGVSSEPLNNSLYRLTYFIVIGATLGALFRRLEKHIERVHTLHTHDVMTGIPNVNHYLENCNHKEPSDSVSLTIQINNCDSLLILLGKEGYGRVLQNLHRILKKLLPDDAVIVLADSRRFWIEIQRQEFDNIGQDFIRQLHAEIISEKDVPLYLDFLVGVSSLGCQKNSSTRFKESDIASLHAAKMHSQNYDFYQEEYEESARRRLERLGKLPDALNNNNLFVMYHPIIPLTDKGNMGMEALIRWRDGMKFLKPEDFIPIVEQTRLINQVTEWVIRKVTTDYHELSSIDPSIYITVNMSQRNLHEHTLFDSIFRQQEASLIPEGALQVEITESTYMHDRPVAESFLKQLRNRGVQAILDDFGTEYSSLSCLCDLPVQKVKIDRRFISNMSTDIDAEMIVKTFIDLFHHMNLEVVAEGVESREALDRLKRKGCDYGQGFYFSRPMVIEDAIRWLGKTGVGMESC